MRTIVDDRLANELSHSRLLAKRDPESLWGWATAAGRLRARRRAELIMKGARLGPGCRVLEVGCGSGMFTEMFAGSGADIVALDLSPDLLALARRRAIPGSRVQFVEGLLETFPHPGPCDAVVGSSVLHHLDLEPALVKIFQLLRPGGRLSFAEPNLLNPQVYVERRFRRFFPYVSPDETAFTRRRLRRDLEACGFRDVRIAPFDWLHPAVPVALIPLVSRLGWLLERIWPIREFAGSLAIQALRPEEAATR